MDMASQTQAVRCSLSHRNLDEFCIQHYFVESFFPKVGVLFEVCEYEGFPEIFQEGNSRKGIPGRESAKRYIFASFDILKLLSPRSKSHEMLGDGGIHNYPLVWCESPKMFGMFKLHRELQVGINQNLQTKS